jgi:hypothetical protein
LREEEGEEEALSQTILVNTRAGRKRKATSKAKGIEVEKAFKRVEADVRGGRKI